MAAFNAIVFKNERINDTIKEYGDDECHREHSRIFYYIEIR